MIRPNLLLGKDFRPNRSRRRRTRTPRFEALEDRKLLTTGCLFNDNVIQTVLDAAGDSYVIGSYVNTVDFGGVKLTNTNPAQYTVPPPATGNRGQDGFVAKYDPNGNLLWAESTSTLLGATGYTPYSVTDLAIVYGAAPAQDTIYVAATDPSLSAGIPNAPRTFTLAALTPDGGVAWQADTLASTYHNMTADASGVYLAGWIHPTGTFDFDPDNTNPAVNSTVVVPTTAGMNHIAKFSSSGIFQWVQTIEPTSGFLYYARNESASDGTTVYVAVGLGSGQTLTLNGQAVLTGVDITKGNSAPDTCVVKLNATDGSFEKLPSGAFDVWQFVDLGLQALTVDSQGNVYLGGDSGQCDPDPAPGYKTSNLLPLGTPLIKISGNKEVWAAETTHGAALRSLAVSPNGMVYAAGEVNGDNGPVDFDAAHTSPGDTVTPAGFQDVFVWAVDGTSGAFRWVRNFGGPNDPRATCYGDLSGGIAADNQSVRLGGQFYTGQANFGNGLTCQTGFGTDGFLLNLTLSGTSSWVKPIGSYVASVDDGGPGFSTTGSGWNAGLAGFLGDSLVQKTVNSTHTATWTLSVPLGSYDVFVSWAVDTKDTAAAYYRLNGTKVGPFNQQVAPTDFETVAVGNMFWARLGTVTNVSSITVTASDPISGKFDADAILVVPAGVVPGGMKASVAAAPAVQVSSLATSQTAAAPLPIIATAPVVTAGAAAPTVVAPVRTAPNPLSVAPGTGPCARAHGPSPGADHAPVPPLAVIK